MVESPVCPWGLYSMDNFWIQPRASYSILLQVHVYDLTNEITKDSEDHTEEREDTQPYTRVHLIVFKSLNAILVVIMEGTLHVTHSVILRST